VKILGILDTIRREKPSAKINKMDSIITEICIDLVRKSKVNDPDIIRSCTTIVKDLWEGKKTPDQAVAELSVLFNKPPDKIFKHLKRKIPGMK